MSTTATERPLDAVIFGATGFTGASTVCEAVKQLHGLRWAIAGRNEAKLRQVLEQGRQARPATQPGRWPDSHHRRRRLDDASLRRMSERCRIVINCAGPYRHYGEPVMRACIATGTHHVDVAGEPGFVERMQLEYDAEARKKGVYVVSTCGFDSIPNDMGALFAARQFGPDGELNSIESYLRAWVEGGRRDGALVNYGTYESLVHGIGSMSELLPLRRKLFPKRLPERQPRICERGPLHRTAVGDNGWAVPFLGADRSVMERTQRFLWETKQQRPVQVRTYVAFNALWHVLVMGLFGGLFMALSRFKFGRRLLLAHPRFFSMGLFSHDGPSEETQKNTRFTITFLAKGWSKRVAAEGQEHLEAPDKTVVTRVSGTNPGYGATCVTLLLSARTILEQSDRLPKLGGVMSPGSAFAKTDLIEKLNANGLTFEVLSA